MRIELRDEVWSLLLSSWTLSAVTLQPCGDQCSAGEVLLLFFDLVPVLPYDSMH